MAIDREFLLWRKKRARKFLAALGLIAVLVVGAFFFFIYSKDRVIASRFDVAVGRLERISGLSFTNDAISTDMTSRLLLKNLRVEMGEGRKKRALALVGETRVDFRIVPKGALPVKVRSVGFEDASFFFELDPDGRPVLPAPVLGLLLESAAAGPSPLDAAEKS